MSGPTHIRLDRLDIRLQGHTPAEARILARDLPDALSAALAGRTPEGSPTLAETVAAQVARDISRSPEEDER
jgi:hypothetical protein